MHRGPGAIVAPTHMRVCQLYQPYHDPSDRLQSIEGDLSIPSMLLGCDVFFENYPWLPPTMLYGVHITYKY